MNKFTYSEIFRSLQGEGKYTGINSLWLRFHLCNLQCDGFGQKDPTDPSSYILPYKDLDLVNIKTVEELPVFDYGCDSSYTWSKRYQHLMAKESASDIADHLEGLLTNVCNVDGKFKHAMSNQETHMCFTGGEPMLKASQLATCEILNELAQRDNHPAFITVETNGTQMITEDLEDAIDHLKETSEYDGFVDDSRGDVEWFWSVSPKIFSTSGEKAKKAIKPLAVKGYKEASNNGQLKYVVNGTDDSWREVREATDLYRAEGIDWPVYIMPVGATKEQQEGPHIARICDEALARGYNVSGRLHCYLYGNKVGT